MRYLLTAFCAFYALFSVGQVFPPVSYPSHYFRDPLGIPMSLAANFGELRPNHYHMGLDIRTQKKENLPVFAAADGYIARVKIEPFGFGQAIYINHPNGYTTLYAHLNRFFPALAAYIEKQQYKAQSWEIFIDLPPDLFPVKKGDQIAFSGNRGGSQGPHLHFEIRRTSDDTNLNPLLFGLPVPDHTSPDITRLAVYDRNRSTYDQSPVILPVHKVTAASAARSGTSPSGTSSASVAVADYAVTPSVITVPFSRISFAISAFDTQSGSANPNGIYEAVLYDNDRALTGFQMNNISYSDTRNINAHIDYRTRERGGPFFQHLSMLPGYPSPSIYRAASAPPGAEAGFAAAGRFFPDPAGQPHPSADGVIDLGDGLRHSIRIAVKDAYGNTAVLRYMVLYRPPSPVIPATVSPAAPSAVPGKEFYPGMIDGFETENCAFYIGEKSLYDSVFINYKIAPAPGSGLSLPGSVSSVFTIGAPWIPLLEPLLVRIRSGKEWTVTGQEKLVMVCSDGKKKDVRRPEWQGGWASARFGGFGNFQLVDDREAPVITPIGIREGASLTGAARLAFTVKDNLDAIRSFRAELDGRWLCFTNDKGGAFIYIFDEHCLPGRHLLRVTVEDIAGNQTTAEYNFIR